MQVKEEEAVNGSKQGCMARVKYYANFECVRCYHEFLMKHNNEFYEKVHQIDEDNTKSRKCCYTFPVSNMVLAIIVFFGIFYGWVQHGNSFLDPFKSTYLTGIPEKLFDLNNEEGV